MKTPVSFPIAQLLKENGFDRVCNSRYWVGFENDVHLQVDCEYHNWNDYDDCSTKYYSAPTIEEVFMWLHEKHGIWDSVQPNEPYVDDDWCFTIFKDLKNNISLEGYNSPTEAYKAAIDYTLNKFYMNKIEQMLSENHGLHTSYSVKNKDGEFESVVSVKSAAEITEQIAIEFADYYFRERFNENIYSEYRTSEQIFQEFLKTKQ